MKTTITGQYLPHLSAFAAESARSLFLPLLSHAVTENIQVSISNKQTTVLVRKIIETVRVDRKKYELGEQRSSYMEALNLLATIPTQRTYESNAHCEVVEVAWRGLLQREVLMGWSCTVLHHQFPSGTLASQAPVLLLAPVQRATTKTWVDPECQQLFTLS
jgi:hypothetical protein